MPTQHLTVPQILSLIGFGGIFWAAGVLQIRYAGHIIYANNVRRIFSYLAAIPAVFGMLFISEGLVDISSSQRLMSTTIMSTAALMMDGTAYMWCPSLYENPSLRKKNLPMAISISRMGAAWLLWTFGTGFLIALIA